MVDAFNDVSSARGDKETLALAADAYASRVIPDARGEAARQIEGARGDASHRLAAAQGQIARFEALRAEPRAATRVQLRHDMLQVVGPRLEVIGARPGAEVRLDERP